jgi:hypothetical protein
MLRECGAKARTKDFRPCRQPAMANGRCRLHGGFSTGAKTKEGRQRIKQANMTHGFFTKEAIAERKALKDFLKESITKNFRFNDQKYK